MYERKEKDVSEGVEIEELKVEAEKEMKEIGE